MSKVLTLGTFDLLHPGHIHLFETCRRIAGPQGEVFVSVNADEFVQEYKGRPPIQTWNERVRAVAHSKYVDYTSKLRGQDAKPAILGVKPDFLVIGSDWAPPRDYYAQLQIDQDFLMQHRIALLYLDRIDGFSSTELKERIRAHD